MHSSPDDFDYSLGLLEESHCVMGVCVCVCGWGRTVGVRFVVKDRVFMRVCVCVCVCVCVSVCECASSEESACTQNYLHNAKNITGKDLGMSLVC